MPVYPMVMNTTTGEIFARQVASGDIGSGAIQSGSLGNGAVVSANIASGQVGAFHLASGAVLAVNLASGAVQSGDIGGGAIVSGNIASGQVFPTNLASGAVLTNNLASGVVTSGAIASGQIGGFHVAMSAVLPSYTVSGHFFVRNAASESGGVTIIGGLPSNSSFIEVYQGDGVAQGVVLRAQAFPGGGIDRGYIVMPYDGSGGANVVGTVTQPNMFDVRISAVARFTLTSNIFIASGYGILSGGIQSGQIGPNHLASGILIGLALGSGDVVSGNIGAAAIVSGNIASGQIGTYHLAGIVSVANMTITSGFLGGIPFGGTQIGITSAPFDIFGFNSLKGRQDAFGNVSILAGAGNQGNTLDVNTKGAQSGVHVIRMNYQQGGAQGSSPIQVYETLTVSGSVDAKTFTALSGVLSGFIASGTQPLHIIAFQRPSELLLSSYQIAFPATLSAGFPIPSGIIAVRIEGALLWAGAGAASGVVVNMQLNGLTSGLYSGTLGEADILGGNNFIANGSGVPVWAPREVAVAGMSGILMANIFNVRLNALPGQRLWYYSEGTGGANVSGGMPLIEGAGYADLSVSAGSLSGISLYTNFSGVIRSGSWIRVWGSY